MSQHNGRRNGASSNHINGDNSLGTSVLEAGPDLQQALEEAIELSKAFMKIHLDTLGPSYEGTVEVRQMFDPADFEGANH